ncbi:unnamed protein product (macronuclear) [Paramecium tetraurelia]|uniref:Uncharacterized protein n=1 Tax=Paramecium tetraurelia TaxID=5888 RepID=A0BP46_PARTE|nr:uncharacterized protein GSPATT00005062001 [Paramecium tetraurelia]CAK60313.1 unnamed protein product [Paramecium tetraurelia]|eukprot:XP_001427711.1 hypothetical protein (macronuclear) [Paramecium tetraurelia strain d4-2]
MNQQQNQQEGVSFPPSMSQQPPKQFGSQFGILPQPANQPVVQPPINNFGIIPQFPPPNTQASNQQTKPPQLAFNLQNKQQQIPPIIPSQPQSNFIQQNNPSNKPMQFQNPQPNFGQIPQGGQNPPNFSKIPFPKADPNTNNNNKFNPQNPTFAPNQNNPQFPMPNKFPQPMNNNIVASQPKYDPMIVKDEYDKMKLVENFTKYIGEGNFNWAIECLKQIISNDIRVKIKDGQKNSN